MAHKLTFSALHEYEPGVAGISVSVELRFGEKHVRIPNAKLDTGATHCIFQREYGELLGLNVESGTQETFGMGEGSFLGFGHNVSLSALGIEHNATVYFANLSNPRNVLGRYGWFQQLRIGIVDYEGKLFVSRYGDVN